MLNELYLLKIYIYTNLIISLLLNIIHFYAFLKNIIFIRTEILCIHVYLFFHIFTKQFMRDTKGSQLQFQPLCLQYF